MKLNHWTKGLLAAGVVSLGSAVQAEEAANQVMTALSSTTLSGYIDTSAIWKVGTGNAALPGRAFDGVGKLDGFNMNVVNLTLEKPLDEGEWSAGYKAELIFGPDGAAYDATGQHIKQAYVALRAPVGNGIDFKVGAFDTIIGYEGFNSYANPNYSRSFGWQLEPTQHTGVLASYQVNDWIGFSAGIANTVSPGFPAYMAGAQRGETHKTYMGSIVVTAPDSAGWLSGSALYIGAVDGFGGNAGNDTTSLYLGGTMPTPIEGLSLGLAFDYLFDNPGNFTTPATANSGNWAWAAAAYVSYQASEKLKLNARLDYVTGSPGTFYTSANATDPQSEIIAPTVTLDYQLWENVVTRAEVRWDHSLSGDKIYGGTGFGGSDMDKNALTLALNVIYKF